MGLALYVPATPKILAPDLILLATKFASPVIITLLRPLYPLSGVTVCAVVLGVTVLD